MSDSDTFEVDLFSTDKRTEADLVGYERVTVNVTNKSQKDVNRGSVSVQNAASGDTITLDFGYIRANGGSDSKNGLLNGFVNTVIAQFFCDEDGSDWKGVSGAPGAGIRIVNIGLNDKQ